jgi:hypothetical protein
VLLVTVLRVRLHGVCPMSRPQRVQLPGSICDFAHALAYGAVTLLLK